MGRAVFCAMAICLLLGVSPSLHAADNAAMLYADGAAWLNGSHVPKSSAIFVGDKVQTRADSAASVHSPGSSVTVLGDSVVEFQGSAFNVDHGGVTIATSKRLGAIAGDVRVAPVSNGWTEFDVTDTNGTVRIAARKGDVTITDDTGTATLAQGQETTRDEQSDQSDNSSKKKHHRRNEGATPAASGSVLNSPAAIATGTGVVVGIAAWVLIMSDDPVSPSKP